MDPFTGLAAQDSFPRFADSDVMIILRPGVDYHLHAKVLRSASGIFHDLLCEENGSRVKLKSRTTTLRYRLELQLPDSDDVPHYGKLILRNLSERGRPIYPAGSSRQILEHGMLPSPICGHYENFFRALYHQALVFTDENIQNVLQEVVGMVEVAESLNAMSVVTLPVDSALLRYGQTLWRSIATNPCIWVDLAHRVRSELIYKEAIIHLVGQWKTLEGSESLSTLRPDVKEVCEVKAKKLDHDVRAALIRMMGYYPSHLRHYHNETSNVGPGSNTTRGRGTPAHARSYREDIFGWMAMNLYRQWLGQHIAGMVSCADAWTFFRAISSGGEAYLTHVDVESFTTYFPLSSKARTQFMSQLTLLKENMKPYVAEFVHCNCLLDINRFPVTHLTCTEVERTDMVWLRRPGQTRDPDQSRVGFERNTSEQRGAREGTGQQRRAESDETQSQSEASE